MATNFEHKLTVLANSINLKNFKQIHLELIWYYTFYLMGTRLEIKKMVASLGKAYDFELLYLKNQLAHEGQ